MSLAAGLLRTTERTMRLGDATGEAVFNNAGGYDLGMAISSDVAIAADAFVTLGSLAEGGRAVVNAWLDARAEGVLTARTNAARCVDSTRAYIAENPGATPVRAEHYNHWAARTSDGTRVYDPTLRDNLKALGLGYRDIKVGQEYFTVKQWLQISERLSGVR